MNAALKEAVSTATQEIIASDSFEELVKAKLNDTIKKAVDDAFSWNTDLKKQVDEAVKNAIGIDLSNVSLPEYNIELAKMVRGVAEQHYKTAAHDTLIKELNKAFEPAPAEITVQELVNIYLEEWKDDCGCDMPQSANLEIERSDVTDGWNLKLEKDGNSYSSDKLSLYIRADKSLALVHTFMGKNPTVMFGGDGKVYQMYCAGTIITDIDTVDAYQIDTTLVDYD